MEMLKKMAKTRQARSVVIPMIDVPSRNQASFALLSLKEEKLGSAPTCGQSLLHALAAKPN